MILITVKLIGSLECLILIFKCLSCKMCWISKIQSHKHYRTGCNHPHLLEQSKELPTTCFNNILVNNSKNNYILVAAAV